jgi:hypothetical protein
MDILDKINILLGERDTRKLSGKASAGKKSYERKKYRMTKKKKKASLKRLERSAEGDKRAKRKARQPDRTPTGKKQVRYHV